jgi:hypothetical protein
MRVPAILFAALAALLVFAAIASAETRTGESTTIVTEGSPAPEATIVKAGASYEPTSGTAVFNVTTAGALNPESLDEMFAALTTSASCATPTSSESLIATLLYGTPPLAIVLNQYSTPLAYGLAGSTMAPQPLVVAKTVSGATTTLSVTSGSIAAAGYNCAVIGALDNETEEEEEGGGGVPGGATFTSFPISAPPPPPTPPAAAASSAPPAPAPAPPVLSIGKLKPVTLKVGKSALVKVKVTNTGGTGTGGGSLRVKAPKGVVVKPERQQIPALAPGKSWTLTVRVQLTAKAKKKSTLSLTAAASGVTASGSLAVTLKG